MVARGEVWWYEPPDQARRPHLILSRSESAAILSQVLAVPATRTVRQIPVEVSLDEADGMPVSCVLNLDNTTLIRPTFCTERITRLGPDRLQQVCDALGYATDC